MSLFSIPTPPPPMDDDAARKRIRSSLKESLLVEAAAGTGKTTELVNRIVAVLREGLAEVQQIVAVTFTRKAAGELKLRLRQRLDQARQESADSGEKRRFENAISRLEEASIGTIHSFCAEILRERPVEARVDPSFQELSEVEAPQLFEQAFRLWIQEKLNHLPEGLRRALSRLSLWTGFSADTPLDRLRQVAWNLIEWRDFPTPWVRRPFDRQGLMDAVVEPVLKLADLSGKAKFGADPLRNALTPARDFATWMRRAEAVGPRNYDALEANLDKLLRDLRRDKKKGRGFYAEGVSRQAVLDSRDAVIGGLEELMRQADADLAACLRAELWELVGRYEDLKRRSGKLDFVDLLIKTRDLLRANRQVRQYFQARYSHIFVDEFQDTDPLQAEILLLLAAQNLDERDWRKAVPSPGKLFLVGDPKQSIYRFRRADVLLYLQVRDVLARSGVETVHLARSFRSLRPIQEAVNAAFAPEMIGDRESGQPEYVPLLEYRPALEDRPAVAALPVPHPYGWSRVTRTAVEAALPDAIAAYAEWLVRDSGWRVQDPDSDGQWVPIAPRHICLLFRRFLSWGRDVTRDYTSSLEARGISHQLVGARSFHQREEVEALKAALMAVEWPDDELSVFATLRGTFFAIADNLLLRFKLEFGGLHPFRPLPEDLDPQFEPIVLALSLLKVLHKRRNRRPVVESLTELLEATRAHAGFALRPAGNQVLANVQRVCDMARAFEIGGGLSFRGFVEQLSREAGANDSSEGPLLEEGAEGVRIMTVHAAKGLEFPIVILSDMTAHLARQRPDKYVDIAKGLCASQILGCAPWELLENEELELRRDQAEGVRIAYVAATRARDLLVVPVVGDEKMDGWLTPLNQAVYPTRQGWRRSQQAAGCPAFGQASVMTRPQAHDGSAEFSVKPGLHQAEAGGHAVVWWDPGTLRLGVDTSFGLRQEQILAPDPGRVVSQEAAKKYEEWKRRRDETLRFGGHPTYTVFHASLTEKAPEGEFDLSVEVLPREPSRPAGKRFGTLVHALLRDVGLRAREEEVRSLARLHARVFGCGVEEIAASVRAVMMALNHTLIHQAEESHEKWRELPVLLRLPDNRLLEGSLDLLFRDPKGIWTVVDFKTDADLKVRRKHYQAQLAWYVKAVGELTGDRARGVILGV